jgi:hypothetical protein
VDLIETYAAVKGFKIEGLSSVRDVIDAHGTRVRSAASITG